MSRPPSHQPARLETYMTVHGAIMAQYYREYFVSCDNLVFEPFGNNILMYGEIGCCGKIVITVDKLLEYVSLNDDLIQTVTYSYNVRELNVGNIFRYDNTHPHPGHADAHHRDNFDFCTQERLEPTHIGAANWPTLGDVVREAQQWHANNADLLSNPNEYVTESELAIERR